MSRPTLYRHKGQLVYEDKNSGYRHAMSHADACQLLGDALGCLELTLRLLPQFWDKIGPAAPEKPSPLDSDARVAPVRSGTMITPHAD